MLGPMALSQIQCLNEHHVNWRVSESKPEFFYSEDQRLAVEALVAEGRDAFTDYIRQSGVRDFLSEPELERIAQKAEAYRPGHEHLQRPETPGPGNTTPGSGEEAGDGDVSLQYWPDRSEASVAELDLGWPEAISYRGVTRVTVHTQPPVDGQTHIKEVVRKTIAAAQKVGGEEDEDDDGGDDDDDGCVTAQRLMRVSGSMSNQSETATGKTFTAMTKAHDRVTGSLHKQTNTLSYTAHTAA